MIMKHKKDCCIRLGAQIKAIRQHRRLSAEQVAERIGVIASTYFKYESGEIDLCYSRLCGIAEALQVHVARMICYDPGRLLTDLGAGSGDER